MDRADHVGGLNTLDRADHVGGLDQADHVGGLVKKESLMPDLITKFLKYSPVKTYINEVIKIKVSDTAVNKLISNIDSIIRKIIKDAEATAKNDKRKTISIDHMTDAIESNLGKKVLSWEETVEEIIKKNPTELGKISRAINDYIDKGKK